MKMENVKPDDLNDLVRNVALKEIKAVNESGVKGQLKFLFANEVSMVEIRKHLSDKGIEF